MKIITNHCGYLITKQLLNKMGYMEEVFERAETKFTTDIGKRNWLKGFSDKKIKNDFEQAGADLFEQFEISDKATAELQKADTLEQVRRIKRETDKETFEFYGANLPSDIKAKEKERATDIFENVGASGAGINRIIDVLERNDYDLSKLRYHAFEVRGRQRIGVWEVGKRGFIANITAEPKELTEATPNFEIFE